MDISNYNALALATGWDENTEKNYSSWYPYKFHGDNWGEPRSMVNGLAHFSEQPVLFHVPIEIRNDKLLVHTEIHHPGGEKFDVKKYLLEEDNFLHEKYRYIEFATDEFGQDIVPPPEINPFVPDKREWQEHQWFALFVKSGKERAAIKNLKDVLEFNDEMRDKIGECVCSIEKQIRVPGGYKEVPTFPNYVFIQISPDPAAWNFVRSQRWIGGFVSKTSEGPKPLKPEEIEVFHVMEIVNAYSLPKTVYKYEPGMQVKVVKEGPFYEHEGVISWTKPEETKCGVSMMLFNRLTTVELTFGEIECL